MEPDCLRRLVSLTREEGFPDETEVNNLIRTGREVIAHARELHTILDGRTTPPTDAEIEAHEAADGAWLVTLDWGDGGPPVLDLYSARDVKHYAERSEAKGDDLSCRVLVWRAVDRDGRPCAWPTAPGGGA